VNPAPVALFVYRRPAHTRRAIQALQRNVQAADTDLIVFSDAAREPAVAAEVDEVRRYIKQVAGFRSIALIERERNLGLANSIIDGVTQVCREHGQVIVMEDDLVVSRYFLHYMNRTLDKYANSERVMQISGYMFPVDLGLDCDAAFFPLTTSWGWACWQRSWAYFDEIARGRDVLRQDSVLRAGFNLNGAYDYFSMLEQQGRGLVDSWAIRWYLSVFLRQGLVLYPVRSLVHNAGFDAGRTHGIVPTQWQYTIADDDFLVARLPDVIAESPAFSLVVEHIAHVACSLPSQGPLRRVRDRLNELLAKAKGPT
jgi:hypothetical protein